MTVDEARERVLAQVNDDELVELARKVTSFPSFSGQEKDCAEWVAGYLREQGFEVELLEVEPGRPNVVARLRGDGSGASIMLNGHTDVDPIIKDYQHDPWKIEVRDGKLWGHGLSNMKAGLASLLHAGVAVKRSGIPLKGDLVVAAVVGELNGGLGTRDLIKRGIIPDLALIPEPSNMNIRTVHSSVFTLLLKVTGQSAWMARMHSQKTVNAIEKMMDVIGALRDLKLTYTPNPELPGLPRFLVGTIVGGLGEELLLWRTSYVPDRCFATMEVRVLPDMSLEGVLADIDRTLGPLRAADPDLHVEVLPPPAAYREPWRAIAHVMPALNLPKEHPLAQAVLRNYRRIVGSDPLRFGAEDPGSYAGTDCGHLFEHGVKCLIFGPNANIWGQSYVELEKLSAHSRIYAAVAAEVLSSERAEWV